MDGKLLSIVADYIATPIFQIFNLSLLETMSPQAWREAKVISLCQNSKAPLLAQIVDQSACYQPFVNFWKKLCLTRYNAILL
jgi:hypothetical protein